MKPESRSFTHDSTETVPEYTPATSAPAAKPKRVEDLMAAWPVSRFNFTISRRMGGYIIGLLIALAVTIILTLVLFIGGRESFFDPDLRHREENNGAISTDGDRPFADGPSGEFLIEVSDNCASIDPNKIGATNAALVDVSRGEMIASLDADKVIYPASMTKVMTLIVAVENLPSRTALKDTVAISTDAVDAMKLQGASGIGLAAGEQLSVESLLYMLMLQSDGVAAVELARYVAGSEAEFVKLMNEKADDMGLKHTHFENPTGLHHKNHTSTAREIATIMAYAMRMELCRDIMKTQSYKAPTVGADGKTFDYNVYHNLTVQLFNKYTTNQPKDVTVITGKTGFTDEGRYCLVTYAESANGHGYVCVTANGDNRPQYIEDYLTIYNTYIP